MDLRGALQLRNGVLFEFNEHAQGGIFLSKFRNFQGFSEATRILRGSLERHDVEKKGNTVARWCLGGNQ